MNANKYRLILNRVCDLLLRVTRIHLHYFSGGLMNACGRIALLHRTCDRNSLCCDVGQCPAAGASQSMIHSTDLSATASLEPESASNALLGSQSQYVVQPEQLTYITITLTIPSTASEPFVSGIYFEVSGVQNLYITSSASETSLLEQTVADSSAITAVSLDLIAAQQSPISARSITIYLLPVGSSTKVTVSSFYITACYEPGTHFLSTEDNLLNLFKE